MQGEFVSLWNGLLADLRAPGLVWQLAVLALCLALAKLAEGLVRGRVLGSGRVWDFGHGSLKRVVFPLVAVLLLLVARPLVRATVNVNLLSLAIPLLLSLAGIRMVFYVLRHSFPGAGWLASFERAFALLVWSVAALHITGLLPELVAVLEGVAFPVGKQTLTLWQVLQGAVTVLGTVFGALWASGAVESRLNRAEGLDANLRVVFARLSKALLVIVAVLIGLPLVGIDLTTLSVFGGALGVGLGFGLQKIASNYVSGFIILLDRSIRIGNMISVGQDRGEVTRITTRYTVLRNTVGIEALVPNELLVGSVVQNESYTDRKVRIALPVQVAYDSDLERAMAVLVESARGQPRVLAEPAPTAAVLRFADSGIDLELGVWIADPEAGTQALRSEINLAIWRGFKAAGIAIPFPQRDVRLIASPPPP